MKKINAAIVYCCIAIFCCFASNRYTVSASTVITPMKRECSDIDVRNECDTFHALDGCTVIRGTLTIALVPSIFRHEVCNYTEYRFPLLREITDYLIFFDVKGLTSIRDLFPNLTVIRGRRLFLNYALGISNMQYLESLEFQSLIAIQRGHVFIGSSKKLCQLERINFDRLTLSYGENHINPVHPEKCTEKPICRGCFSDYCWSNDVCQKFENDNVVNMMLGAKHCHSECLGGCYDKTNSGCVVCKGLTDHGVCVSECPPDKYLMEHHMRCYNRKECIEDNIFYIHQNQCVEKCPSGFTEHEQTSECVPCPKENTTECVNVCHPSHSYNDIHIYSLSDAERLKGCRILNSSLVITIRNKVDEDQLMHALSDVREIVGHLKIYRSEYLTSLKFLRNLQIIHGKPLENELYALVIYDNQNLHELWQMREEPLNLKRGSMYIHQNNKLCNQVLQKFRAEVVHDRFLDTLQISDQEVLCGPVKLQLHIDVLSHEVIRLYWPTSQTVEKVEVIYRYIPHKTKLLPESELDSHICRRIDWTRRLLFSDEIIHNDTHYTFDIKDLKSYTQYEVLVKTFDETGENDARSEVKLVKTELDIPPPPVIKLLNTTETLIEFELKVENEYSYIFCPECIQYYVMNIYEVVEDVSALDKRDYCAQPITLYSDEPENGDLEAQNYDSNFEDCCAREQENIEESYFFARMRQEYACDRNHGHNCVPAEIETEDEPHLVRRFHIASDVNIYNVSQLTSYTQYILQIKSCNTIGCSAYTMMDVRTSISKGGDRIKNLHACFSEKNKEYYVFFGEPDKPNGATLAYVIHYRDLETTEKISQSNIMCVTRKNHVLNNYRFAATFVKNIYKEVAVRVYSLAGESLTKWKNITPCTVNEEENIEEGYTASFNNFWRRAYLFIYAIIFGACLALIWTFYKLRYHRRFAIYYRNWLARDNAEFQDFIRLREHREISEDRQILVDDFETVRFRNNPELDNLNGLE